jgi:hypothetical protein
MAHIGRQVAAAHSVDGVERLAVGDDILASRGEGFLHTYIHTYIHTSGILIHADRKSVFAPCSSESPRASYWGPLRRC